MLERLTQQKRLSMLGPCLPFSLVSHSSLPPILQSVNPNWLQVPEYTYSLLCLSQFELGFLTLATKTVIINLIREVGLELTARLQILHSSYYNTLSLTS